MKKKQLVSCMLVAAMLSLSACGVKTKSEVKGTAAPAGGEGTASAPASSSGQAINLNLLYQSNTENVANVVRDELSKAGFNVTMNAAADGATFRDQQSNGNFDIAIASWANPVGTPDYGCRGIWETGGDGNRTGINDEELNKMINEASKVTSDQYKEAYGKAEQRVIEDQVYMTPLYQNVIGRAFSKILAEDSVTSNQRWERFAYEDSSMTDQRPLVLTQTGSSITTFDPIRADDSSSGYALDHMYIHLLTLEPDWSVSTKSSLSYNFCIAEGNQSFYFILRDDCHFARINKDKQVTDSGVMIAGEDVVYSLNRAKDPNSTPMHMTYSMFSNIDNVELVTDLKELEETKTADGKTVKETLEAGLTPISELEDKRDNVNNASGKYQVVRVNTKVPYPQILNCLTFHGAGIVDSDWVESQNKNLDVKNYDASKDHIYGDSVQTVEGASYDNQLSLSGTYVLTSMNDYQMNFTANPYLFKNDTSYHPISTVTVKFITDKDAALSSLRSGDVDYCYSIPETKYDVVKNDSNLYMSIFPGFRVYVLAFNMHGNSVVSDSVDLRKAISSCIVFNDIKSVLAGNAIECNSPLASCLDTGIRPNYQPGDTEKYLNAYWQSAKS